MQLYKVLRYFRENKCFGRLFDNFKSIFIPLALWIADPAKIIVTGTQTVATIDGLTPATSYHIRVIAENALGTSEPSEEGQGITQEEGEFFSRLVLRLFKQFL